MYRGLGLHKSLFLICVALQLLLKPPRPQSEPCCALITPNPADSNILPLHLTACYLRSGTSLKYRPLRPVSHNNLLSPPRRYHNSLIYLLRDASSSGCAQLVVSSARQTLHRQLKALMSWATFGASNPEEYRLRDDFLTYCLLLLELTASERPSSIERSFTDSEFSRESSTSRRQSYIGLHFEEIPSVSHKNDYSRSYLTPSPTWASESKTVADIHQDQKLETLPSLKELQGFSAYFPASYSGKLVFLVQD